MFPIVGLIFLAILVFFLFLLYKQEWSSGKKAIPKAIAKEYWNGKERRKYARFKKTLEVQYMVLRKNHAIRFGKTVDISEGGMKLMMDEKLAVGTAVNLKISIPNSKKIAEIESDVVWSEDSKETDQDGRRFFYTGVKFSAIKEPYGNYLINYIRSIASSSDKSIIASQD